MRLALGPGLVLGLAPEQVLELVLEPALGLAREPALGPELGLVPGLGQVRHSR